jgi:hypothetical protein
MRIIPILIASTLFAAPVAAQQPATPAASNAMLDKLLAMDTNKDGKWDKAEWLAGGRKERGFTFFDVNKDGFLTLDELKTGAERLRSMGLGAN